MPDSERRRVTIRVENSVFTGNGGAGIRVSAPAADVVIRNCAFYSNVAVPLRWWQLVARLKRWRAAR